MYVITSILNIRSLYKGRCMLYIAMEEIKVMEHQILSPLRMSIPESKFWAWKGTIERNLSQFSSRFNLYAQGCPEYLLTAMMDLIQARMELTKQEEDDLLEDARNDYYEAKQVQAEIDEVSDDVDPFEKMKLNVTPDESEAQRNHSKWERSLYKQEGPTKEDLIGCPSHALNGEDY